MSTIRDRIAGVESGLAVKAPCVTCTTANITLSGEQTVNGVACVDGDRVLVKNQTSSVNNGIYVVATSAWSRALDFDGSRDVVQGTLAIVNSSDTSQTIWRVTTANPITIGSSALTFTQSVFGALDATGVNFVQSGSGAATRTVQARLRDWVSVKDFGAVGDGVTNDSTAFANAIASVSASGDASGGGTVYIPRGTYKLNSDLAIKFQVHLVGDGGIDHYGTRLLFADGKGIHVYHSGDSGTGTDGSWSTIKNLRVAAAAKTVACNGIFISGHGVRIENVSVTSFKSDGIHIVANSPTNNANLWVLDNVRVTLCDGNGLFVDGADANAGVATMVDCSSNGGWGIYDSSFLGNTYVMCHTDANTLGAYKTDDPSARNCFFGCYSESGQPASSLSYPALVIGGLHGAGFTSVSNCVYLDNALGTARFSRGVKSEMANGADTVSAMLGNDAANGDILNVTHTTVAPNNYRLKFHTNNGGGLQCNYNNLDVSTPFLISGPNTTLTFGTSAAIPHSFYSDNLRVGSGANARLVNSATARPSTLNSTRYHAQGDIMLNVNAAGGGIPAWMCVAAGTPGTWRDFAILGTT